MLNKTNTQGMCQSWPANGLEPVLNCPVCGSDSRELLHKGLIDRLFFSSSSEWAMYRCKFCYSAYLDPRPTLDTIHLAYESYYTHAQSNGATHQLRESTKRRLRRTLAYGYLNWRYGTNLSPANRLGIFFAYLFPSLRNTLDRKGRNLPKPQAGAYLLDIGFGDGSFLELAKNAGWKVAGADPDPVTIEAARRRDFDVRQGGIESFDDMENYFDVITLSHVIEHAHDPRLVLKKAYRQLKQGGFIWLETPNIDSLGHRRFSINWRGLEPPRHLVLFNWESLETLLLEEGFRIECRFPQVHIFPNLAAKSHAIKAGTDPYCSKITLTDRLVGIVARLLTHVNRRFSEYVTLQAIKPSKKSLE